MYDEFGFSVALDGTNALVGAYVTESSIGSAYLFRCDDVAGIWIEEAELVASDGVSGDRFGWSVSLSGMRALIGAPRCEDNGDDSGAAYLFYFDSSAGTWQEEAKLLASDGGWFDHFGYSVSLSGDKALIGAKFDDEYGSAYVFRYDSVSGTWQEEAKLIASDGARWDYFGESVALFGDIALIGARQNDDNGKNSGSAYVYRYDGVSETWQEEAKLLASDGSRENCFGVSVAIRGDKALIGAYGDTDNGIDSGSAYVFCYDTVSGIWQEETKLLAADGYYQDNFGVSVALSGEKALIGAWGDGDNGSFSGSAYVFGFDGVSETWQEEAKLLASDGAADDFFGCSVALDNDRALIGAPWDDDNENNSGSAYLVEFTDILALDVKCNGQDQNVIVDVSENVTLTIDIDNGYHPDLEGDFWVVAILPISGWNTWTYGPWMNPIWRLGTGNEYYTGPPLNHAATVCDQPLPPGSYKLYLAMDAIPNGVLNLTALWDFDVVDFTVQ